VAARRRSERVRHLGDGPGNLFDQHDPIPAPTRPIISVQAEMVSNHEAFADVPDERSSSLLIFEDDVQMISTSSQHAHEDTHLKITGTEGRISSGRRSTGFAAPLARRRVGHGRAQKLRRGARDGRGVRLLRGLPPRRRRHSIRTVDMACRTCGSSKRSTTPRNEVNRSRSSRLTAGASPPIRTRRLVRRPTPQPRGSRYPDLVAPLKDVNRFVHADQHRSDGVGPAESLK